MKAYLRILVLPILLGFDSILFAQATSPDSGLIKEGDSLFVEYLVPKMTKMERDALEEPEIGQTVFITNDHSFHYHNGSRWVNLLNLEFRKEETMVIEKK